MEVVVVDGEEGGAAGITAIAEDVGDAMVDGAVLLAADIEARGVQGGIAIRVRGLACRICRPGQLVNRCTDFPAPQEPPGT